MTHLWGRGAWGTPLGPGSLGCASLTDGLLKKGGFLNIGEPCEGRSVLTAGESGRPEPGFTAPRRPAACSALYGILPTRTLPALLPTRVDLSAQRVAFRDGSLE